MLTTGTTTITRIDAASGRVGIVRPELTGDAKGMPDAESGVAGLLGRVRGERLGPPPARRDGPRREGVAAGLPAVR